jgi:Ca-activated chloride channel homolog
MHFTLDPFALIFLFIGLVLAMIYKSWLPPSIVPSIAFSRVKDLQFSSFRSHFANIPSLLHKIAFSSLLIAFADPHFLIPKISTTPNQAAPHEISKEGIAIYLVLDQSGSMAKPVKINEKEIPKIELLKNFTQQFIANDSSDLVGLVSFARIPQVLVPLTLDRATLQERLDQLKVVTQPDEDGTGMGYAIYKTAGLLSATRHFTEEKSVDGQIPYEIKSAIIVVVTDGFQDPSHLDEGNILRTMELDDAAAYAKKENIRLYVINIDPSLATTAYGPQRRQLQKVTEMTGGQFFIVNAPEDLQELYKTIAQLEKGTIKTKSIPKLETPPMQRYSLYPFFIMIGFITFVSALLSNFYVFKIVP